MLAESPGREGGWDEDNLPYPKVVALREDTQTASHREIVLEPIWKWQVVNDKLKQRG